MWQEKTLQAVDSHVCINDGAFVEKPICDFCVLSLEHWYCLIQLDLLRPITRNQIPGVTFLAHLTWKPSPDSTNAHLVVLHKHHIRMKRLSENYLKYLHASSFWTLFQVCSLCVSLWKTPWCSFCQGSASLTNPLYKCQFIPALSVVYIGKDNSYWNKWH